jgi:hypothetical protein
MMGIPTVIGGLKPNKTTAKKRALFPYCSIPSTVYAPPSPHPQPHPTPTPQLPPPAPPLQCKYGGVGLLILFFCLSSHCYTEIFIFRRLTTRSKIV